jgi:SAM-dependent methyltransferase
VTRRFGPPGWLATRGRSHAERLTARARAASFARYARARDAYERLCIYKSLSHEESRTSELIEYFGWDIASRATACRRWFFGDDERLKPFLDQLGITYDQYAVMHQYIAFDRLDPARPDLFWIYDEVLERLDALGGPDQLTILDFGGGIGQISAAFAGEGYRTVLSDALPYNRDFARFIFDNRGLNVEIHAPSAPDDFFDTAADGRRFGLVVESSTLEHIPDPLGAVQAISRGLVRGGVLVSTLLAGEPSAEKRAFFERDAGDPAIAAQLFDPALHAWVREHYVTEARPRTNMHILIKR